MRSVHLIQRFWLGAPSVLLGTAAEGFLATFHSTFDSLAHFCPIYRPLHHSSSPSLPCLEGHNQLGVSQHGDIRIVGSGDDLALPLLVAEDADDILVDRPIVEIVLGLVDDEYALCLGGA